MFFSGTTQTALHGFGFLSLVYQDMHAMQGFFFANCKYFCNCHTLEMHGKGQHFTMLRSQHKQDVKDWNIYIDCPALNLMHSSDGPNSWKKLIGSATSLSAVLK